MRAKWVPSLSAAAHYPNASAFFEAELDITTQVRGRGRGKVRVREP